MPLQLWENVPYLPILALSPAEMRALEELPNKDKDLVLPYIHLRPWVGAHKLESALARIEKAYAERAFVVDLGAPEPGESQNSKPVIEELRMLRSSQGGYSSWCDFVADNPLLIPAIQLRDISQLRTQTDRLYSLGRGVAVHVRAQNVPGIKQVAAAISERTSLGRDVCFVLDLGRQTRDLLMDELVTAKVLQTIKEVAPDASIALSASTFPDGFVNLKSQDIYERTHFYDVRKHLAGSPLIYSDRGSARAEKQTGGGGTPAPRIDHAGDGAWTFFRGDNVVKEKRPAEYVKQAALALEDDCWDPDLRVWGAQMIERAGKGDLSAITSPMMSTAARINMHLHRQLHAGDPTAMYDTDEPWVD